MLPEFKGEPELLANFLEVGTELVNQFYDRTNPENFQNKYLMRSLLAKIKGKAAELIISANCTTWENVRTALTSGYSDKRDIYTLTIELSELKQTNESAFSYLEKVRKYLNLAVMYLKNNAVPNSDQQITFFQKLALRVFLRGLKEPLGSLLQSRNPDDLDNAHSLLTNDFQFYSARGVIKTEQRTFSQYNKPPQGQPTISRPQFHNYKQNTSGHNAATQQKFIPTKPLDLPQTQQQFYHRPPYHNPNFSQTPMSGVQTIKTQIPQFQNRNMEGEEIVDEEVESQSSTEQNENGQAMCEDNPFLEMDHPNYPNLT